MFHRFCEALHHSYLFLFLLLFPLVAWADDMPVIDIVYNEETASVSIPAIAADKVSLLSAAGSPVVRIDVEDGCTTEYCYRVRGKSSAGSLQIIGDYKLRLELAGLDLTSQTGAAFNIACGKRIDVVLKEGTVNTLKDCSTGAQKAAMYFTGHPEFKGKGTLNVTGTLNHAIAAKEYLYVHDGNINVLSAVNDGIHCGKGKAMNANNYFQIDGGCISIKQVGGDAIDSDDYGTMRINGGEIDLTVSKAGGRGLKCDSIFTMTDGLIHAQVTGGYDALNSERSMALNVGQDMTITGGTIKIDMLHAQAKAYKVKGELNVENDGQIYSTGNYFTCRPEEYELDMQVYACVVRDNELVTDYANYQIGAFGNYGTQGVAEMAMVRDNTTFASMRVYGNQAGETVRFVVYDASEQQEYLAYESTTLVSDNTQGSPSNPFELHIITGKAGDVNLDGYVTLSDLTALIKLLKGNVNSAQSLQLKAADVNRDGSVNAQDIQALLQLLLTKEL